MVRKQDTIPTTTEVPPYTPGMDPLIWSQAVAGFCKGSQAVKNNNGIRSLRTGNLVYLQGWITVTTLYTIEVLPVLPRESGYITAYDSLGNLKGLAISTSSKVIDFTELGAGTYYITGQYIAHLREKVQL